MNINDKLLTNVNKKINDNTNKINQNTNSINNLIKITEKGTLSCNQFKTFKSGSSTQCYYYLNFKNKYNNIPTVFGIITGEITKENIGSIQCRVRGLSRTGCDIVSEVNISTWSGTWVDYIIISND